MFDAGTCEVECFGSNGTSLIHFDTLAKGQSGSLFTAPDGHQYQMSVDANGVASLASTNGGTGADLMLVVSPSYGTSNVHTQAADIEGFCAVGSGVAANDLASFPPADGTNGVALTIPTSSLGPTTPAAVTWAPHAPKQTFGTVGVYLSTGT